MRRRGNLRDEFVPVLDWREVPVIFDLGMLARITRKHVECLRRATAAGEIPGVKVLGEWRFHKDKIKEWLGA